MYICLRRWSTCTRNLTFSSMLSILILGLSPRCWRSYSNIFISLSSLSSCNSSSLLSYFSRRFSSCLLFSSPYSVSAFLLVKASSNRFILVFKFWASMSWFIWRFLSSNVFSLSKFSVEYSLVWVSAWDFCDYEKRFSSWSNWVDMLAFSSIHDVPSICEDSLSTLSYSCLLKDCEHTSCWANCSHFIFSAKNFSL